MKLNDIAEFVTDKISSSSISLENYVTTDSLLQNKRGRETAQNLPPMLCALTHYKRGDVLVANIRPYLKKVWFADSEGGCSSDVLVFRAKNGHYPSFLYTVLIQDAFFDYAMSGAKGSKMPRGDKAQIMRYELPTFTSLEEENIGNIMVDIMSKINVNRQINDNLEAMAKQLYDYWFVQFDFPNEEGKPYKSSGGAMVWNEKLKREIPNGWTVKTVGTYANCKSGYAIKSSDFKAKGIPVIKIGNIQEDYTLDMNGCQYIDNNANKQFYAYQNDVVIAMTGATIGKFAIVPYRETGYFVNQRVGKFELGTNPIEKMPYLINSLKIDYFRNQIFQIASGCAQPNISAEQINNISLLYPSTKILSEYNMKCKWMYEQMVNYRYQIDMLTKLRDELLPLLINGQAMVNYHLFVMQSRLSSYRRLPPFYVLLYTFCVSV